MNPKDCCLKNLLYVEYSHRSKMLNNKLVDYFVALDEGLKRCQPKNKIGRS